MKGKSKSGPVFYLTKLGYLGLLGFLGILWEPLRAFRIAFLLCLFFLLPYRKNSRFLFQVIYYALGQMVALGRVRGRLPRTGSYAQITSFSLPFDGFWMVESGGVDKENSHSWNIFNQRYAYILGLCGNSGHSTEPHLHFHVQDRANFFLAIGLPVKFSGFLIQKEGHVQKIKSGYISKGQVVKNEEQ